MSEEMDNLIVLPGVEAVLRAVDQESEPPSPEFTEVRAPAPEFLMGALEAVLFASEEPLSLAGLATALNVQLDGVVQGAIEALRESYMDRGSGLEIMEVAGGYQMRTVRRAAPYVTRALGVRPVRLSKAAVETLAIVAYRQPVTRHDIEELRGVDCGGMLRSLVTRGLVKLAGRKDTPGRPLLYGTGQDFLQFFGLTDLSDLPTLRDLRELREDDPEDGPVPISPEF